LIYGDVLIDNDSLIELLNTAEESEKRARELSAQKAELNSCLHEVGDEECGESMQSEDCECMVLAVRNEVSALFEGAWQGYREVEVLAREYVHETECTQAYALLAQVLMDIHIHPNSGLALDTNALWEAQYLWLHLYYRTGEQAYFEQAKMCDGFRHATVVKIRENNIH
jgi:hypothetical protein